MCQAAMDSGGRSADWRINTRERRQVVAIEPATLDGHSGVEFGAAEIGFVRSVGPSDKRT